MRSPGFIVCCLLLIPVFAEAQRGGTRSDSIGPALLRPTIGVASSSGTPSRSFGSFLPAPPTLAQLRDTNTLTVRLLSRLESRLERNRSNRCAPGQSGLSITVCRSGFQPLFDFDFNLLAGGSIANRVHVDVDYDSQREFDASNNISVQYAGRPGEVIQKIEIGNVSFAPPLSRFITTGIPSGNYGIQAEGLLGKLGFQAIAAQQKGRVVKAESFTIGGRALRQVNTPLEDYGFESRRFFFTVDPTLFSGYPNIDILNSLEMLQLAAALPDTLRPRGLALYRVLIGGQPPNPNGPQFIARGARNQNRGLVYEHMREGIDYYADPSLLWIALVRQLRRDERLVVAYSVLLPNGETVYPPTGGTPDLEFKQEAQFANVLWDPELQSGDAAFRQEIRSAYRVAGEDLVRETLDLRIVAGPGTGQEKPPAGGAGSYLQLFGISQASSAASFDSENRLWPRTGDPNFNRGSGGSGSTLISDYFVIFPSARPFATDGLTTPGNPANDTIYVMLSEDIFSSRRPQSVFRILATFATQGEGESGALALGNVQVRPGSERIAIDGVPLRREIDYEVDYELGRVMFNRPDTLFMRRREIDVQYEENPLFAETPTSIIALGTQLPLPHGSLGFIAINQRQRSTFSRPILGFEPAASFMAGVNAAFEWEVPALARALGGGRGSGNAAASARNTAPKLRVTGELALSRPNPNSRNTAFIESFQGEGGLSATIAESQWYFSSQPVASPLLPDALVAQVRASTLAWQNNVLDAAGNAITYRTAEIDPNIALVGQFSTPEPLLWLTLYPLSIGGARTNGGTFDWTVAGAPSGRRWRSIRALLSPSGADLTRVEQIQFAALIDTSVAGRGANPTVIIDLGDISENSLAFSPDSVLVQGVTGTFAGFTGKRIQGLDTLHTERDRFSRTFDATVNDRGLPGDVADRLVVVDATTLARLSDSVNVRTCSFDRRILAVGDSRANCTIANARLDEEDLDNDGVLNFSRDSERLLRFAVNMADPASYDRVGGCIPAGDPRLVSAPGKCWVHFRIPFSAAELVGSPILRRIKSVRLTVVSGANSPDNAFTFLPLTRIQLSGAPWQKRSAHTLTGIGGVSESNGFVSASLIGTLDSSATLSYQPPPGVREEAENIAGQFATGQIQINEKSLRIRATEMNVAERAEAFFRFPDGQKNFMAYTQLRVWARGRNSGWGENGELNFFMRIGRDADNFYLYRAPINSGPLQSAWDPEIRVNFDRFFALRAAVQDAFQRGVQPVSSCTATDSALVAISALPGTSASSRIVACDGPYMIYTVNAAVTPPSLSAVQELAVGMVRVRDGGGVQPIAPGDTLELWVDEIRLTGAVSQQGYAGFVGLELTGSDRADLRLSLSRRDRNFRQLAEQPSFVTQDVMEVSSTLRLDRFTSAPIGWSLPLTITHSTLLGDPSFIALSDIPGQNLAGLRSPRDARTSYSITARRSTPSNGAAFQNLLGALVLNGSYASSGARSEYSNGRGDAWLFGAAFDMGGAGARASAGDSAVRSRWAPTHVRLSSNISRSGDTRLSFLNPALSPVDTGIRVHGLNHLWRSGGLIEFQPLPSLTASWELNSARDLRDYGDSSAASRAATAARGSLLGADIGMERERGMRGLLSYTPAVTSWLNARLSVGTRFNMTRDPNARFLIEDSDDPLHSILPARLANGQNVSAGFNLDFGRLARSVTADSVRGATIGRVFTPLDVNFARGLLSSFSAADFSPSLLYQLSLGGSEEFREQNGRQASGAGSTNTISASHSIRPWPGATLTNRASFSTLRSWNALLDDRVFQVEGVARTFPDLSLRVDHRPQTPGALIGSAAIQAGVRRTLRNTLIPSLTSGLANDRSRDMVTTLPASMSLVWVPLGGFTTSAEYSLTLREDLRPGLTIDGTTRVTNADISKTFPAGTFKGLSEDLRTYLSFRSSSTRSTVTSNVLTLSSRLVDNGRYRIEFSAESDVSETMVLSLGASQLVTYDRNFNRRTTQTQLLAVLHINFFSGNFR